jgi:hypothetical protein
LFIGAEIEYSGAVYTRVGISKLCSTEGWIYGVDWRNWSELLSGFTGRFDIIPV